MSHRKVAWTINRILLALVMLIPGFLSLFIWKPSGVIANMTGLGFPAPVFFAWLLIVVEVVFGLAVLFKWKLKYTVWPPIAVLVVASFTAWLGNWPQIIIHLAIASNFWIWGAHDSAQRAKKKR